MIMSRFCLLILCLRGVVNLHFDEELYVELEEKKDANYRDIATNCINQILNDTIKKGSFITITQVHMESYPQFEITQRVIKYLHEQSIKNEWSWEITNGTRRKFESFEQCLANCNETQNKQTKDVMKIKYHNKKIKKTGYYLIFLDKLEDLTDILDRLKATDSYDINAFYVLVYGKFLKNSISVQNAVLRLMYTLNHYKTILIAPVNMKALAVSSIVMFQANQKGKQTRCGRSPKYLIIGNCNNGTFKPNRGVRVDQPKRGLNCIQDVQLMIIPPMVTSLYEGVEIEILNVTGGKLNISYTYTVQRKPINWGILLKSITIPANCTTNCSRWTGDLRKIDEDPFLIGVGRVTVTPTRSMHFKFAVVYYMEDMLWIVPSANLIPPWAAIVTIFEWPTWTTLFGLVLLMGLLTYGCTILCGSREHNYLHDFSSAMVVSVEIFFITVVATQPKSNPVRCLFICYALFMIIIGSLYQSSLINVLTNPRYEHQIDTEDEVFESGIGIGGLESRKDIFNNSLSERDTRIYNSYETYATENDTEFQWLLTVAKDRDTITILGQHYAQYYIDRKDRRIVDIHTGRAKVHLIKTDVLYAEQVSIVFPSTFVLKEAFNDIITLLIESGLVQKWRDKYSSHNSENMDDSSDAEDTTEDEELVEHESDGNMVVIKLDHLQGAFSFYAIGHMAGMLAFVCEHMYCRIRQHYKRKRLAEEKVKRKLAAKRHRVKPAKVLDTFERFRPPKTGHKLRFIKRIPPQI